MHQDPPMVVCVVGAAGRTGRIIASHLYASDHPVRGLVRSEESTQVVFDLRLGKGPGARAIQPVVADVLGDRDHLVELFRDCEAVVNATGASEPAASGPDVNRDGAIAVIEAARAAGVRRLLHLSCMYADRPAEAPDSLRPTCAAKHDAEQAVRDSDLDWTIVRPGPLEDSGPAGQLSLGVHLHDPDPVSREDVAAVFGSCLALHETIGYAFDVAGGTTYLLSALDVLLGRRPSREV